MLGPDKENASEQHNARRMSSVAPGTTAELTWMGPPEPHWGDFVSWGNDAPAGKQRTVSIEMDGHKTVTTEWTTTATTPSQ